MPDSLREALKENYNVAARCPKRPCNCDGLLDPVRAAAMKRNWDVNDVSEMRSGGVSWTTSAISSESEALGHRQEYRYHSIHENLLE